MHENNGNQMFKENEKKNWEKKREKSNKCAKHIDYLNLFKNECIFEQCISKVNKHPRHTTRIPVPAILYGLGCRVW